MEAGRVLVIGAGISGMTSALSLAGAGFEVTVLEKASVPAPLVGGFSFAGLTVETGFHYTGGLGPGGPLTRLLQDLGLGDAIDPVLMDPEGYDLVRGDIEFDFPSGYEPLAERLKQAFPGEENAVDAYLGGVRAAYESLPILDPERMNSPRSLMETSLFADKSLKDLIDPLTGNDKLKRLFCLHTLLHGAESSEVPFSAHAAVVGSFYEGPRKIKGGGNALRPAFVSALAAAGIKLLTSTRAEAILIDEYGRVTGVRASGGAVFPASCVIYSGNPKLLFSLFPEGTFRPAYEKRIAGLKDSSSGVMFWCESDDPPPELMHSNYFLIRGDATVYVTGLNNRGCQPAGFLALAPCGYDTFSKYGRSGPGERTEGYRNAKEDAKARILDVIRSTEPRLLRGIGRSGSATPLTFADFTGNPEGGLYGIMRRVGAVNPFPATKVPGFYLTGQAVAMPGIFGAVAAGVLTARALIYKTSKEGVR